MSYTEDLFSLDDMTCLVTGASRGIGKTISDSYHLAGANVYGIGRSENCSSEVDWQYLSCDVTDKKDINDLLKKIKKEANHLNVLVNAAGVTIPSSALVQGDTFVTTLATNLVAVHDLCTAALPLLKQSGKGSIINITSIGSEIGFPNNPGYIASKGGLRMLTKALAYDYSKFKIRVNNIAPGYIKTDMTASSFNDNSLNQERLERMLIKRWGDPTDLSGAAIFLASDASSYITGTDLFVDGGWTAKGL